MNLRSGEGRRGFLFCSVLFSCHIGHIRRLDVMSHAAVRKVKGSRRLLRRKSDKAPLVLSEAQTDSGLSVCLSGS